MLDMSDDLSVLAATLWGEARGEGREGIVAVASVISNRVRFGKHFGSGWKGVCLKPWQFTCWSQYDPNSEKLKGLDIMSPATAELLTCVNVAREALAGILSDPTGGARFYKVSTLPWPRDWGSEEKATLCTVIGHHSFYNLEGE